MTHQAEFEILLNDFDELFISSCHTKGLSLQETQHALLESPQRNVMLNSIAIIHQTSTAIPPVILPKASL